MLLVGRQEEHPACKNWLVRYWQGYLSEARCRWFAYGPADATATSCSSKIQNGLPYWCRLTQVVLEKWPLNGCSSNSSFFVITNQPKNIFNETVSFVWTSQVLCSCSWVEQFFQVQGFVVHDACCLHVDALHLVQLVTWHRPRQLCVRWGPSPPKKGAQPPIFWPMSCGQRLDGSRCHLVGK